MNTIRLLIVALVCVTPAAGFSPRSPYRHVVSEGEFFIVVDPYHKPEQGTAYQVTDDGFKRLWQSKDWYGYPDEVFLASDGMSLVRFQRIPSTLGGKKIEDQSVLFFYFKGKLVKEYKLPELIREMGSLRDIGSYGGIGSMWMDEAGIVQSDHHGVATDRRDERSGEQTYRSYNHFAFRLKTLEKKELFFDLLDGKRIDRKKIAPTDENKGASGDPFENQKTEQAAPSDGDKPTN